MNILKIKDCKNCIYSVTMGSLEQLDVKCDSSNGDAQKFFKENGRYCAINCKYYKEGIKLRQGIIKQEDGFRFITAGKSELILHSTKTNEDFRFKLTRQIDDNDIEKELYFVNLIKTSENIYAGILVKNKDENKYEFKQGKKGNIPSNEISIRSLVFVINQLYKGEKVNKLEIYHVGRCGCCWDKLVTDKAIETGICKICEKLV